jgi:hypothetical protein
VPNDSNRGGVPLALIMGSIVMVSLIVRSEHGEQAGAVTAILGLLTGGLLYFFVPIANDSLRKHWPAWDDLFLPPVCRDCRCENCEPRNRAWRKTHRAEE